MSFQGMARLRRASGAASAVLFGLCLLFVLGGITARYRLGFNVLEMIPGQSLAVNGPMPVKAEGVAGLVVEGGSGGVGLSLEEVYTGYWFGGRMWKGTVRADSSSRAGEYVLSVKDPSEGAANPQSRFRVKVRENARDLRRHSPYYSVRLAGARPFPLAASLFVVVLFTVLCTFLASRGLEIHMAKEGKAEIYMLKKSQEGFHITFGLGTSHGVRPGMELLVLCGNGSPVARAAVVSCTAGESTASVRPGGDVRLGYIADLHASLGRHSPLDPA